MEYVIQKVFSRKKGSNLLISREKKKKGWRRTTTTTRKGRKRLTDLVEMFAAADDSYTWCYGLQAYHEHQFAWEVRFVFNESNDI